MSTPSDGGPAFPIPMWPRQADGQPMSSHDFGLGGMMLRDWFAGQALAGILANQELLKMLEVTLKSTPERNSAASYAYAIAESMLKERGQ